MARDDLASAKDKFFAAAGAQYATSPKDYILDEKVKFVPAPTRNHLENSDNPSTGSKGLPKVLEKTGHYWLHADTMGGTMMEGYFMSPRNDALPEVLDTKFQFSMDHMATKWDYHVVDLDEKLEVKPFS